MSDDDYASPDGGKQVKIEGQGFPRRTVAVEFLEKLRPGGPWVLTAIKPDGPTKTITASTAEDVATFVDANDGENNVYYSVNPTRTVLAKKASKADIAAIEFALADLDPNADETSEAAKARYLALLNGTFEPKPTAIIDSGNGIQCLWRLDVPIPLVGEGDQAKIDNVEARVAAIMVRLGSKAGTQNIDRILRLPGTTNLPTKTKRKAGRVPCPTGLLHFNGASYSLEDFPLPEQPRPERPRGGSTELPQQLRLMLYLQGDEPAGYPSRSELFWAFINAALRECIDENVVVTECLNANYAGCSIFEHVADKGGESYVKDQLAKAANDISTRVTRSRDERAVIDVTTGDTDLIWRKTEKELLKVGCPVYVRGAKLVQPLWRWEEHEGHTYLNASFVRYSATQLTDMIAHHVVRFRRRDGRKKEPQNIDPPKAVVEALLGAGHWELPTVVGIVNSPTLRPDGSMLTEQGYDKATQLWYKSSGDVTLPDIPERPTIDDAKAALVTLAELLSEFPFDDNASRSAALAAMMTPALRGALRSAVPLFAVIATEPRSGKTFLVQLIALIATGHVPIPTAGSENQEEMERE